HSTRWSRRSARFPASPSKSRQPPLRKMGKAEDRRREAKPIPRCNGDYKKLFGSCGGNQGLIPSGPCARDIHAIPFAEITREGSARNISWASWPALLFSREICWQARLWKKFPARQAI